MSYSEPTRADDEMLLRALWLRDIGWGCTRIARLLGKTEGFWRCATNRVRAEMD